MIKPFPDPQNSIIAIIGLGYVGLPLASRFAQILKCEQTGQSLNRKVIGYDINAKRVEELKKGIDLTNELKKDEFNLGENLSFTCDISDIINADFI